MKRYRADIKSAFGVYPTVNASRRFDTKKQAVAWAEANTRQFETWDIYDYEKGEYVDSMDGL